MADKSSRDKFMRRAIEIAQQKMDEGHGGPFGCVIVKDQRIIAEGFNAVTSTNDPTAHAEVQAIRQACEKLNSFQLNECEVYTSCEPCPMCLGALYWARPKKIYYASTRQDAAKVGFDDQFIYDEFEKSIADRKIKMEQLLPEEGAKTFKAWQEKPDKVAY